MCQRTSLRRAVLATALMLLLPPDTRGAVPSGTDRIEEDWQAVVATPAPEEAGPQLTLTMSPVGDNTQMFASFNLNYRDNPFRTGGYQVVLWDGTSMADSSTTYRNAHFSTRAESLTWTQVMVLDSGRLWFDIDAGQSATWGSFGQWWDLAPVGMPTTLTNLSAYDPTVSVARSGATWQSNRVQSMTLLGVRYYSQGVLIGQDDTARTVDLEASH